MTTQSSDLDFIIAYETGEIEDEDELIAGFQRLIDSGLAWRLQGHYGRTAAALIEAGHCTDPNTDADGGAAEPFGRAQ